MAKEAPARKSRWQRMGKLFAIVVLLPALLVAALPWILSTSVSRNWVLAKVNRSLRTGRLQARSLRFSWSGPIRAEGLVLRDKKSGKILVDCPSVDWDRGLWQLLTDRPHYGTIRLRGAKLDLEERVDGHLDLAVALGIDPMAEPPTAAPAPPTSPGTSPDVTMLLTAGSLRVRRPGLPDFLVAERMDLDFRVPPASGPMTWKLDLAKPGGETFALSGRQDRSPAAASGLTIDLTAHRWPSAFAGAGVVARGRLDGSLAIRGHGPRIDISGDARILNLDASGPALAGDRLVMDTFGGAWDVSQSPVGWSIRRLDVACPIASLTSRGAIPAPPGVPAVIEGKVDLAALSRLAPHALRLREGLDLQTGTLLLNVDVRGEGETQRLDVVAKLSDLVAHDPARPAPVALRDPATITAGLLSKGTEVHVERLGVKSEWLTAEGSGDLDRGVHAVASFDLSGLERQFHDLIDFHGIELAGRGKLEVDYRREGGSFSAKVSGWASDPAAVGLASSPIRRKVLNFSGDLQGPADVTGLPLSWRTARLGLASDGTLLTTTIARRDGGIVLDSATAMPMEHGGLETHTVALWRGQVLDIAEASVHWKPAEASAAISLSGHGRYDIQAGRLDLEALPATPPSPLNISPGGLHVAGLAGPAGDWTVEGGVFGDFAALDRALSSWLGGPARGVTGNFDLGLKAKYIPGPDQVELGHLAMATRYGRGHIFGKIDDPYGRRVSDLQGVMALEPGTLDGLAASVIAPDARVEAVARPLHLVGPLSGDILKEITLDAGLDLTKAEAAGLRLGPAAVVAHLSGGRIAFAPIRTTLNEGEVVLNPEMVLDDPKGAVFRLLPGSAIRNVKIDDDLSRRFLSYAAPVLHDATRVGGRLSLALDRAEFPVGGSDNRTTSLAGQVQLIDLTFGPGPLLGDIFDLAALSRKPEVRLNQTIQVAVADRRVFQRGLAIPVGHDQRITLEGSVGFDRTLALQAELPLPASSLGQRAGLNLPLSESHFPVPIGGTFSHPKIDRRAMARALRDEGRDALRREAESGVSKLLDRLSSPGDRPQRRR